MKKPHTNLLLAILEATRNTKEHTFVEIAKFCGTSAPNIRQTEFRALSKIKKVWEK